MVSGFVGGGAGGSAGGAGGAACFLGDVDVKSIGFYSRCSCSRDILALSFYCSCSMGSRV
jgi:hypothetical protein